MYTRKYSGLYRHYHEHETKQLEMSKVFLREGVLSLLALLACTFICQGTNVNEIYHHKQSIKKYFNGSTFRNIFLKSRIKPMPNLPGNLKEIMTNSLNFKDISNVDEFWDYLILYFYPLIFNSDRWYNGRGISDRDYRYALLVQNVLISDIVLRQVRVKNGTCPLNPSIQEEIKTCYGKYSRQNELHLNPSVLEPLGTRFEALNPNVDIFQYRNDGKFGSYNGRFATYSSNGFVYIIPLAISNYQDAYSADQVQYYAQQSLRKLRDRKWIEESTRAVFIEMTLYNGNVNRYIFVRLVVEFPEIGSVWPEIEIFLGNHERLLTIYRWYIMHVIFHCGIFLLCGVNTCWKYYKLRDDHHWFSVLYNCSVVIACVISLASFCQLLGYIKFSKNSDGKVDETRLWSMFQCLQQYDRLLDVIMIYSRRINVSHSVSIVISKSMLGQLMFGTHVEDHATVGESFLSLLSTALGEPNYKRLSAASPWLAATYFFSFMFIVSYVLLNMLLAIVIDTYNTMSDKDVQYNPTDSIFDQASDNYIIVLREWFRHCMYWFTKQNKQDDLSSEIDHVKPEDGRVRNPRKPSNWINQKANKDNLNDTTNIDHFKIEYHAIRCLQYVLKEFKSPHDQKHESVYEDQLLSKNVLNKEELKLERDKVADELYNLFIGNCPGKIACSKKQWTNLDSKCNKMIALMDTVHRKLDLDKA
ncbi:hypothetical protein GJ496_009617 [Pomphorhynchus laevis]|nr:hypothetical protein GJ496_009617 [Pomphorhynchus laevis]